MSVQEDQTNKAERQKAGEFVRGVGTARNWISNEPNAQFKPERGRYHLYVANNCPWCHRVALTRGILGLQSVISMDVLYFKRDAERGWQFRPELDADCTADTVNGKQYVTEIYALSNLQQKSVPLLWDKKLKCVVSNESAEIIRMFATQFLEFQALPKPLDLYPSVLRTKIDELNAWIYPQINNGAYKAGFSSNQQVYEQAFDAYFAALDRLEGILAKQRYLCSNIQPTEADIRLFPTIFRHDCVYYVRMKLNKALLCYEYRNIYGWMKDMYQYPHVKKACNLQHCKNGYFGRTGNNVIPRGPDYDWDSPHNRDKIKFEPLATDQVLLGIQTDTGNQHSVQTLTMVIKGVALSSFAYLMLKAQK
mmetsp:Transcript_13184/g.19958  ORF Transcript_13184/g.19958 Transcript_13184/m.19958 type:complete len:364 (-) Transcript_13184:41-1132(-)